MILAKLEKLDKEFEGLLFFNESPIHRAQLMAYSTDASVYQERPLAAAGTSCRHQIKDGVGKKAFHPAEILYEALLSTPAL